MNEFQFECPKCAQNILATANWAGRRMTCPSCDTRIIIPAPNAPPKKGRGRPVGIAAQPTVRIRVKVPRKKTTVTTATAIERTTQDINRRRRRRVVRALAGAVIGGVIAGPIGAAVGAFAAAAQKRGPMSRKPTAGPKLARQSAAKKRSAARRKKAVINIHPPIP